jgi:hypothetical protein
MRHSVIPTYLSRFLEMSIASLRRLLAVFLVISRTYFPTDKKSEKQQAIASKGERGEGLLCQATLSFSNFNKGGDR